MQNKMHVAGIVNTRPAKNVNKAIKPLINMAVKIKITDEAIVFHKCFMATGKLFKNVLNEFVSFATTLPVKCVKSVRWSEFTIKDSSERIDNPTIAFSMVFAIRIYEIINSTLIAKNGNVNNNDVRPNLTDFQKFLR